MAAVAAQPPNPIAVAAMQNGSSDRRMYPAEPKNRDISSGEA